MRKYNSERTTGPRSVPPNLPEIYARSRPGDRRRPRVVTGGHPQQLLRLRAPAGGRPGVLRRARPVPGARRRPHRARPGDPAPGPDQVAGRRVPPRRARPDPEGLGMVPVHRRQRGVRAHLRPRRGGAP